MKKMFIPALTAAMMAMPLLTEAQTDTLVWRIKSMRCEECAHKVNAALRQVAGVESLAFNLERRTVTVAYDPARTCPDTLQARLLATKRYKPSAYSATEVIHRGMGLQMADMHCQNCANRIVKRVGQIEGVDSIAPHVDKHYVFFRYDANRTDKATIREVLGGMGFTPVNYYTSKNISFAYFNIPEEAVSDETVETVLAIDGVDDANVNRRQKSLAITYVNTETDEERLLSAIREEGINATKPVPHECKEKNNGQN